jgi:cell division septal protein FtsQ
MNQWIKEAVVRKVLPNKIDVLVTERIPAALEIDSSGKNLILRDKEGVILGAGEQGTTGLPRIIHFNPNAYEKALVLMPLLSHRSDAIVDLSRDNDIRVLLGRSVLRFGDQNFQKRWERFLRVEADLKRRHLVSWEADLRFPSKIVVRGGEHY